MAQTFFAVETPVVLIVHRAGAAPCGAVSGAGRLDKQSVAGGEAAAAAARLTRIAKLDKHKHFSV